MNSPKTPNTMKRILYIEDNQNIRENATELLELQGYTVITAQNGAEGLAAARENMPDIIVCDVMMPELDGYEVLIELKKDPAMAGIPFVFVTASVERKEMNKGFELGAKGYIRKPFDEQELFETVARCLAG